MSDFDYDLFVIGGGSGGVRAARTAAATGARVALAEESRMGGTCVIRGCVPKKLMVFASNFPREVENAALYGWDADVGDFDWPMFRKHLHAELDRLEGVYGTMLRKSGVEIFPTRARVTGPHEITLADGTVKSAQHILIATGGRPVKPPYATKDLGLVSDDMFDLDTLPKSLLIVGGGYIGCEFACMMAGLGVNVTMYLRGGQILNGFDEESRGLVAEMMRGNGIDIHTGTSVVNMDRADTEHMPTAGGSDAAMGAPVGEDVTDRTETPGGTGSIWVKASNGREGVFDRVLFATGRAPNTEGMGLAEIGVELGRRGEIVVDRYSQTSVPSIYAIGDVTDRVQLTPVAIREAMAFTRTVFLGEDCPVDHELIPSAVFTQPELGSVGLTEEQARETHDIEVYATSFRPMKTAFIDRPDRTMFKLIVDKETRVVLGAHIVSEGAGEWIQLVGIAVKNGLTKEQFDMTCAVHPTATEELVTMSQPRA
ncbi:NADPH-glutathione reductase [Palleronia marisminoris]|uniref:Glutathione amide reductase n=1 Tax=Palleronia marisminoris TaxID=315423 RepID=A0A1Y5STY3_9RHOB|nr:FAD-dependent oxidoreductase [Palleronia marisminoris]SFG99189.1 NADPH-glutathione reductase [Palleronia marisminoris]SLN48403.1 Glutathione amide reductase [Palleronia marisminoris]